MCRYAIFNGNIVRKLPNLSPCAFIYSHSTQPNIKWFSVLTIYFFPPESLDFHFSLTFNKNSIKHFTRNKWKTLNLIKMFFFCINWFRICRHWHRAMHVPLGRVSGHLTHRPIVNYSILKFFAGHRPHCTGGWYLILFSIEFPKGTKRRHLYELSAFCFCCWDRQRTDLLMEFIVAIIFECCSIELLRGNERILTVNVHLITSTMA